MRREIVSRLPCGEDSRALDRPEVAPVVSDEVYASAQPTAVDLDAHDIARDQLPQGPSSQGFRSDVPDAGAG